MGELDPLGPPGRAAGEVQDGEIVLGHPRAEGEAGRSGVDDRIPLGERHDPLDLVGERAGIAVGDQHAGAGAADDPDQLGRGEADVQRHQHQAGRRRAEVQLDVAVAVGGEHRHPIAALEPEAGERAGDLLAALGQRGVVEDLVAAHDGPAVGGRRSRPDQRVGHDQHRRQGIRRPEIGIPDGRG